MGGSGSSEGTRNARLKKDENASNVISPTEIPLYHILNARITFSNLNGCEEGASARPDNEAAVEGNGQRYNLRTDTPSPGSDSSSVSSSSSTSENIHMLTHSLTRAHIGRMVRQAFSDLYCEKKKKKKEHLNEARWNHQVDSENKMFILAG